jgi:hypothetical protein
MRPIEDQSKSLGRREVSALLFLAAAVLIAIACASWRDMDHAAAQQRRFDGVTQPDHTGQVIELAAGATLFLAGIVVVSARRD